MAEDLRKRFMPPSNPLDGITVLPASTPQLMKSQVSHQTDVIEKLLSGESVFTALQKAVTEVNAHTSEDFDIVVEAFELTIDKIKFFYPHTLMLSGHYADGSSATVIAHYSQVVAKVEAKKKRQLNRVVTGFADTRDDTQ